MTTSNIGSAGLSDKSFYENAVVGMYRSTPGGRLLNINVAFARVYGFETVEDFYSHHGDVLERLYVNNADRKRALGELQKSGSIIGFEYEAYRIDGSRIWISNSARAVLDQAGNVQSYEGSILDITDHKRTVQALGESEARFRDFVRATSDWLWEIDAEKRYTFISNDIEDRIGRAADDYRDLTLDRNIDEFYSRSEWQPFLDAFDAREPLRDLTLKRRNPNGTEQWIRSSGVPFFASNGDFLGYRGSASDVTENVEREKQLANLTAAINRKSEIVVLYDADDRLVFCNDIFREFNKDVADLIRPGVTFEELTRAGLDRGLIPEAVGQEEEWLEKRLERHQCPKGPVEQSRQGGVWHLIQEQRLEDGGIVAIVSDITDRKRAEQALQRSEAQLRLVIDNLPVLITYVDTKQKFRVVNQTCADWYNRTKDEIIGKYVSEIHGDRYALFKPRIDAVLSGESLTFEDRNLYPDGVWRDIRSLHVPHLSAEGVVQGYFSLTEDITESKRAERALRESEARFRDFAESASDWLWETDAEGRFSYTTSRFYEAAQFAQSDVIGKSREAHFRENYRPIGSTGEGGWDAHFAVIARREPFRDLGIQIVRPSGEHRVFLSNGRPIHDEAGNFLGYRGSTVDVTERHALEERLRLAQKLEAVGQLTGGIAHEFNNLLQVVAGNIELLEGLVPPDEMTGRRFQTVRRNVTRGAELTSRLLSFARRQPLAPKAVEIAIVLAEMQGMLRQTLGETIAVRVDPTGDAWAAEADPGQLENALLNLALNARDAMPNGGVITLSAQNIRLDEQAAAAHEEATPGDYVVLSVTDNGSGMTEAAIRHAFEPFFTTKDVGKGTGLGLSMVYGFAHQSGGFAAIESKLGVGTTMRLYLPRLSRAQDDAAAARYMRPVAAFPGSGTILVVEDDADVRESMAAQLTSLGYRAIEAEDGASALSLVAEGLQIDLLFTDVVMPGGLSGFELARQILQLRPKLKILYTTGYSEAVVEKSGQLESNAIVLRKPYDKSKLAATISQILN